MAYSPVEYWWNGSGISPISSTGTLLQDGPLNLSFTPGAIGSETFVLRVEDALGTVVTNETTVQVTSGPATILLPDPSTNNLSVPAGTSTQLSWSADNAYGDRALTFSGPLAITFNRSLPASNLFWLNESNGPLVPTSDTGFSVPSTDWINGTVSLNLTSLVAGNYSFTISAGLPISGGLQSYTWRVTPDLNQLAPLSGPSAHTAPGTANDTGYRISDRYGNALSGGYVIVRTVLDGVTTNATTPILSGPNGSFVWVNLSLVPGISEELTVLSTSGQTLLTSRATASPVVVAQAPSNGNSMITDPYLGLVLIAVAATIAAVIAVRLRSRSRLQPRAPSGCR